MTDEREFRRLGPYLLVRVSGAGGMGWLELALRVDAPRSGPCVIKRLREEGRGPQQEARFRREAQIAARLEHENIARTLRVEEIDEELCLAQEFVEGVDLARIVRQLRPLTIPRHIAAYVIREVCKGLHYAHEFAGQGIVHRDVTPENVMVSFAGDVKLVDFGIARSAVDASLTTTGTVVGRREYIPPEVWEGETADRRADIYSLGVVLWELLTGKRLEAFAEVGPGKTPPDPCTVDIGIPSGLGAITSRALAHDPADRYSTAEELRQALGPFVQAVTDPKADLVGLLRDSFKVDLMRDLLAQDVADARRFLAGPTLVAAPAPADAAPADPVAATSTVPEPTTTRPRRRPWAPLSVGAALAVGLVILALHRSATAPEPTVARAPAPPVAPSVAVATPAASEPIQPALGPPRAADSIPSHVDPIAGRAEPRRAHRDPAPVEERKVERSEKKVERPPVHPDDPAALMRQAHVLWEDHDFDGALALLHRAEVAGGGAPAYVFAAAILIDRGKRDEAQRNLVEALRLDPQNAQAKKLLPVAQAKPTE